MATEREYSAYDPVTRKRFLHKLYSTTDPNKQFDYDSLFDVFRVLSLFAQQLASAALRSNFAPDVASKVEPYVCFVSRPVFPVVMQQVGLGVDHDLVIHGHPYKILNQYHLLPYGYGVLYDLNELYRLGKDKPQCIILHPMNKDILDPTTVEFLDNGVKARSALTGQEVNYQYDDIWAIPRVQYCKWSVLRQYLLPHLGDNLRSNDKEHT